MAYQRIQLKRGLDTNLPTSGMLTAEPLFTTDRCNLIVATDSTTKKAVTPAIGKLDTLASINLAADLMILHDADGTGQKEKKMTVADFKSALNIPGTSTDEKVAVVSGGTAGYIWGTDGSDGVLRMGSSLTWAKNAGNGYVTLEASVIDGGTF